MILVTGATGTVGRELVLALSRQGVQIRVFVRDPARLPEGLQADVCAGVLEDTRSFARACKGVERLFLLTKPSPEQQAVEAALARTAARTGVGAIVRLAAMAPDAHAKSSVRAWHGLAEDAVLQAGLILISVRANFFMQNLLSFGPGIRKRGVFSLPAGAARVSIVDAADVAEAAAAILTRPRMSSGAVTITGPQALSFAEVGETLSEATQRPIAYRAIGLERFRERMEANGSSDWYARAVTQLYVDFQAGLNAAVSSDFEDLVGRPTGAWAAFVQRNIEAFRD